MKVNILGVQVDKINQNDAIRTTLGWLKSNGRHYIVTPNVEMVMQAQHDKDFKKILNQADLAIPDSARFGWAHYELNAKNKLDRFYHWPLFFYSKAFTNFPVTTGIDLTYALIKVSEERGFVVGFFGGRPEVAMQLVERLKKRYPKLKIGYIESDIQVNKNGDEQNGNNKLDHNEMAIDILFVALGHGKQEKWIAKNRHKYNIKLMIGVGGALDYLSGSVVRAPEIMRSAGFEWLFRIIIEPWRAKRFLSLFKFVFLVIKNSP